MPDTRKSGFRNIPIASRRVPHEALIPLDVDYAKVDLTWLRVGDSNTWREVVVYVVLEDRTVCFRFIMAKGTP